MEIDAVVIFDGTLCRTISIVVALVEENGRRSVFIARNPYLGE